MSHAPDRLGRYEIVKRVGRGGMGTVYLARDPRLNRTVALKVLADFATSEFHERFLREARAAAALRHHHIVTVYDIGEDEGLPFIAMEYVEGETLAAFVSRKPAVPAARKLQIAAELCTGLLYAHRAGIIHRDVKPGNVMLAEDGSVKILDFGLARWVADVSSAGLTQAGTLLGSPHYMSPEQISGQAVDQRSDIFAVGAVLYELFTYQKAFPGESTATILHRILFTHPTPVRALCPDLEPELEAVISRTLQKAPENRYQTLQELLQDLATVRAQLSAAGDTAVWQPGAAAPEPEGSGVGSSNLAALDLIARQRADQIQAHLADAVRHFDQRSFEDAAASCEQALLLDPQEPRATDLRRRVRVRIEDGQIAAWLSEASEHLLRGELTRAEALVDQCLKARPDSSDGLALRRAVQERRSGKAIAGPLDGGAAQAPGDAPDALDGAREVERTRLLPQPTGVADGRSSPARSRSRWIWISGIAVAATVALVAVRQFDSRETAPPSVGDSAGVAVTTDSAVTNPGPPTRAETAAAAVANPLALVEQAGIAYKEGRLGAAIELALDALKLDRANNDAAAFLARVRDDGRRSTAAARDAAIQSGAEPTSADFTAAANAERLADQTRGPVDTARAVEQYRVARERYQAAARTAATTAKAAAARAAQVDALLARVDASLAARNYDEATRLAGEAQSHDPSNPRVQQARERIQRAEESWRAQQEAQEARDVQALLARADRLADLQQREVALMDAQGKYPRSTDIRAALTRTRDQMKRAAPAPPPSPSVDRGEIVRAVKLYADAYATLSADAVRAIYPNAPSRRQEGMESQKKACRKLQVMFDESRIQPVVMPDGRVLVDVPLQYDCAQPTAGRRQPPVTMVEQMTLSRQADGRWLIVAMAER